MMSSCVSDVSLIAPVTFKNHHDETPKKQLLYPYPQIKKRSEITCFAWETSVNCWNNK